MAVVKWSTRRIVAPLFEGSNPFSHPNFIQGRSQVGKATDFDSVMRWFESSRPCQDNITIVDACIEQMGVQWQAYPIVTH